MFDCTAEFGSRRSPDKSSPLSIGGAETVAKLFRLLGDPSVKPDAERSGAVVYALADRDIVVETQSTKCEIHVLPKTGQCSATSTTPPLDARYIFDLRSGSITSIPADAPSINTLLEHIFSEKVVIKSKANERLNYVDPLTHGDILAASLIPGEHTPGYSLDELRVVPNGSALKALVIDGVTGHDGLALCRGERAFASRKLLGSGLLAEYLPDLIINGFNESASHVSSPLPQPNPKAPIPAGETKHLSSVCSWLYPQGFSQRLSTKFFLELGPLPEITATAIAAIDPAEIPKMLAIDELVDAAHFIVAGLDSGITAFTPLFQEQFNTNGAERIKGSAALAGLVKLPTGKFAVFSCGDCEAYVLDKGEIIAATVPFNPRFVNCTIGAVYDKGTTTSVPASILSLRIIPETAEDPVVVLSSDGCIKSLESLRDLKLQCGAETHLNPAYIEHLLCANSNLAAARQGEDLLTDDRTVVALKPNRLGEIFGGSSGDNRAAI